MPVIEFEGKQYDVNEAGYLVNFADWCEEWVAHAKNLCKINILNDDHEIVIIFARGYYAEKKCTPTLYQISKNTGFKLIYLYSLFPDEPRRKISLMAGLPDIVGCVQ
jgi:tRNA 2-thiouridine synthesizing protein E